MPGDKLLHEMTDEELLADVALWTDRVAKASGWASAYFSAKQLAAAVDAGNLRGMNLVNQYPIRIGDAS